ncbi:NAD-dependent epimerase/dehydratase family protein, partial [Deltaproteobacteria bacterium TL4]
GKEVLRSLVEEGHEVLALVRSGKSATLVEALGAFPVIGDLMIPGSWQKEAAKADWVIHLAQPLTYGQGRVTRKRAENYRDQRIIMDKNLLAPLDPTHTRRVIYVGGTSYYGDLGTQICQEEVSPNPHGWGPYLAPAIELLEKKYIAGGLPIVTAFPGWVYGNGSWFRGYMLKPLLRGKTFVRLRGPNRWASPIHLQDCARAITFLCDHGEIGSRYFLVDDCPLEMDRLVEITAQALGVSFKISKIPVFMATLYLGSVITDSIQVDTVLSNQRLKVLGFQFKYPNAVAGIAEVVTKASF